ncbi:MAG TPA: hypothetical protein VGF99_16475, partial [Myxococcota bacterium]
HAARRRVGRCRGVVLWYPADVVRLVVPGLCALAAFGCSRPVVDPGHPSAPADGGAQAPDVDSGALAQRPPDVIDARTRPEPHPLIPVGTRLTAYVGPRFVTGEDFVQEARVVVADETGRVRALLRALPAPNPYVTVTLPGALAVAGLHDPHVDLAALGERLAPTASADDRLRAALAACADAGFVAVHDVGTAAADVAHLKALDDAHALPLRVFVYVDAADPDAWRWPGAFVATDTLQVMGVAVDGARADLAAIVDRAHAGTFQVAVQSPADGAGSTVHDVVTALAAHHRVDVRDRLETAVDVSPEGAAIYDARISVVARDLDATSVAALGPLLDRGIAVAATGATPAATLSTLSALTTTSTKATPTTQQLRVVARHAAWAVNLERHAGALTPGMYFDVTVFDVDHPAGDAGIDWRASPTPRAVATVVGGALRPVSAAAPPSRPPSASPSASRGP